MTVTHGRWAKLNADKTVIEKLANRPDWFNDDGSILTDEELAGHDWFPVQEADPVPDGKVSAGKTVQLIEGVPKWVHSLADAPPPSLPSAGIVAQARFQIVDFEVFGINGESGISGAFVLDTGLIYCEFRHPLPWSDYIVTPTTSPPHSAYVDPDQQMAEGFLLFTQDGDGPSFPATVQLLVTR